MKRAVTLLLSILLGAAPAFAQGGLPDLLPPGTPFVAEFRSVGSYADWTKNSALGRIWAEPEMQVFVRGLEKAIADAVEGQRRRGPDPFMKMGLEPEDFLGIEIGSMGIAMLGMNEMGVPEVLLHVDVRKGQPKIAKILASLRNAYGMFVGTPFEQEKFGDATLYSTNLGPVEVAHIQTGNHFFLATGAKHIRNVLPMLQGARRANLRGSERFQGALRALDTKSYQTLVYLDPDRIRTMMRPLMGEDAGWMDLVFSMSGLDAIDSIALADIPVGANLRTELALKLRERRGIFALAQTEPTRQPFLGRVPADALLYGAERFDLARFHREALAAIDGAGGNTQSYRAELARYKEVLGFDFEQDLLGSLGDEWAMYLGGTPGGALLPDVVLVCSLRDRAKLQQVMKKLVTTYPDVVKMHGGEKRAAVLRHRRTKFAGQNIDLLELSERRGDPIPITPSWTIGDDYVAFALWPQALKHFLGRRASLRESASLGALAKQAPQDPSSVGYFDLPRVFAFLYNTSIPAIQGLQGAINRELKPLGAKISLHDLPRAEVFLRHLTPIMSYTKTNDEAFRFGYVSSCGLTLMTSGVAAAAVMGVAVFEWEADEQYAEAIAVRQDELVKALEAEIAQLQALRAKDRQRYAERLERLAKQIEALRKQMKELE
ncbi:MAG: DUF3352 domain-containing protein [Planctomycetota bacterium]